MKYAGIIKNDICAAPGVCVSFFTQGCPHHCPGCHNPETWAFEGGYEFTPEVMDAILAALTAQGVHRDLCIMGGEPLCPENAFLTSLVIRQVKESLPDTKVYIWSGYTYDQLKENSNPRIKDCLDMADVLIDGPFIAEQRDVSLFMRGSRNQNIIDLHKNI